MEASDIKPGRTYEGADGERRTVTEHRITTVIKPHREKVIDEVEIYTLPNAAWRFIVPTAGFAAWAVREVES